jgi:hypothetical protein
MFVREKCLTLLSKGLCLTGVNIRHVENGLLHADKTPGQLVDLILQSRPDIKRSVVMSAIQQTHDEFSFVLEKPDRATLLDGGAFFT